MNGTKRSNIKIGATVFSCSKARSTYRKIDRRNSGEDTYQFIRASSWHKSDA
ncbi:hypothetical protein DE171_000633 [Clostridium beijerinckii]|nr:hypothetical protein [Clostridium beijerinckii]